MATLNRYDGTKTTYSLSDLEQLLAHLSLSNSAGVTDGQVFFWGAAPYVVIVDLAWLVNRKLSELFTVMPDPQSPFNLAFVSDSDYISLSAALLRCGYAGPAPVTADDLAKLYMVIYQSSSGGADAKVSSIATGSSLVASSGNSGTPASLKGLLAGQGIRLTESGTDISIISDVAPVSSTGSGTSLIDPSSTSLATRLVSLAVQNGLTLSTSAGVLTLGLGPTLRVQTLQSSSGLNALSLTNAGVNLVLNQIFDADGNLLATFDQQLQLVLAKDLKCRTLTAVSVKADNLFVSGDSLAIPSGTQFKSLSDSLTSLTSQTNTSGAALTNRVASLETDNTANKSSLSSLSTRVSTLETSSTSLTNGIASLTTTVAQNTTDLFTVKSTQTTQTTQLSNIITTVGNNSVDIASLKTRASALESTSATGSGVLPFAASDIEARRKGIPQYSLYRNTVREGYVMRHLADSAYMMNVINGQSFMVQTSVSNANGGWTIEWWAKTYRLFQQTMICIQSTSQNKTISFGISGGGAFNVMWNGGQHTLANPEVSEWYLYGCQVTAGSALLYMSKQGQVALAPTFATISLPGYENLGAVNLFAGRDPANYSYQGSIASPRLVNAPLYFNYIFGKDALRIFTSFPLDATPDHTRVVLDGNPIVNKVSPNDGIVVTGLAQTAAVPDYVDNWVPL